MNDFGRYLSLERLLQERVESPSLRGPFARFDSYKNEVYRCRFIFMVTSQFTHGHEVEKVRESVVCSASS